MREAFLQLLNGGQPDEIVWCTDLTYWVDGNQRADLQSEEAHLRFCRDLGAMPYFWYGKFWAGEPAYNGVEILTELRGDRQQRTFRTPVGKLVEESAFLEGSWSEAPVRHPVRTEADLDVLLDLLARRQLKPANLADYRSRLTPEPCGDVTVDEMRAVAGNDQVVLWGGVPGAMFAPPFTWAQMRAHVTHLLESWRGTRFIVGVADQVPPNGQIEFVQKIAEVIRDR